MFVSENKKKLTFCFFYLLYCPWVTIRSRHSTADRAIMQSVWNSTNKYMHKCKCEKSLKKCQKCQSGIWYSFQKVQLMGSRCTERKTYSHTNRYFSIHTHMLGKCVHMKIKKQLAKPITTDNPNCVAIVVNQLHGESCHNLKKNFYPSFPHYCKCVDER